MRGNLGETAQLSLDAARRCVQRQGQALKLKRAAFATLSSPFYPLGFEIGHTQLCGLPHGLSPEFIHRLHSEHYQRPAGAFRSGLDPEATAAAILGSIGAVLENLGAKRPLLELAEILADLHHGMVAAR